MKAAITEEGASEVEAVLRENPCGTHAEYLRCGRLVQERIEATRGPTVPEGCGLFLLTLYLVANDLPLPVPSVH